jgi:hypothetical protein
MLAEALVARGIDVTLFATLDSQTAGKLDGVVPASSARECAACGALASGAGTSTGTVRPNVPFGKEAGVGAVRRG